MEMKQNNYENNIRLEKKFTKQIKAILGMQFIGQDAKMDREQATDFLVLTIRPFQVACRLRTYKFYTSEYRNEFTIRCSLFSGNETELDKIRKGYCNYIFYGFVDEKEEKIIQYFIGNLDIFRDYEGGMNYKVFQNTDNQPSKFAVYKISEFPKEFIVKIFK